MIHYQLNDAEHATVSESKRKGAHFDRAPMMCLTGDGHAQSTQDWAHVTCQRCLERRFSLSVTRFVATYVNKDGMRTLIAPAQGRYTYELAVQAQAWIDSITANNSPDRIREIWGDNPRFEVRPCLCWPGHFDPKNVWFDN